MDSFGGSGRGIQWVGSLSKRVLVQRSRQIVPDLTATTQSPHCSRTRTSSQSFGSRSATGIQRRSCSSSATLFRWASRALSAAACSRSMQREFVLYAGQFLQSIWSFIVQHRSAAMISLVFMLSSLSICVNVVMLPLEFRRDPGCPQTVRKGLYILVIVDFPHTPVAVLRYDHLI